MSNELGFSALANEITEVEMRTATRHPILQRCYVYTERTRPGRAWQCVAYNISAKGVGVALPVQVRKGTVLMVDAFELPRAKPLRVRVVQAKQVDVAWFTGCELVTKLTNAELQVWRSGPRDWMDKEKS